jgi:redox-sensitive bicupin YhaK (pirin superfamily)
MLIVRKATERGVTKTDWLTSYHSFSFGDYRDQRFMGFGPLRVINDDVIAPDSGFPEHPHWNAEIISYVMSGHMTHRDSMGTEYTLSPGEFQVMTTGSGVTHSEFNASLDESVRLIQIWLWPDQRDLPPQWAQKVFQPANGLQLIAAPAKKIATDEVSHVLPIHQDALLYRLCLSAGDTIALTHSADRQMYLHLLIGRARVADQTLDEGDAVGFDQDADVHALVNMEALLFDLPK